MSDKNKKWKKWVLSCFINFLHLNILSENFDTSNIDTFKNLWNRLQAKVWHS